MVLAASKPLVVEAVLLARVFQRDECRDVAAAWGAVKVGVAEVPRLGRARPGWTVLSRAARKRFVGLRATRSGLRATRKRFVGLRAIGMACEQLGSDLWACEEWPASY